MSQTEYDCPFLREGKGGSDTGVCRLVVEKVDSPDTSCTPQDRQAYVDLHHSLIGPNEVVIIPDKGPRRGTASSQELHGSRCPAVNIVYPDVVRNGVIFANNTAVVLAA